MSDETVDSVARSRMDSHEEVCAARYLELSGQLSSLNTRLFASAGGIIALLIGVIITLLTKGH